MQAKPTRSKQIMKRWVIQRKLSLFFKEGFGKHMRRGEAVTLLTELSLKEKLVRPSFVSIDHRNGGVYQLKFKGEYDRDLIEKFVQKRNFSVEEDKEKGFIVIF